MSDPSKRVGGMAMDGFGRVRPLTEGHLRKGGLNATSQIRERPPGPAPMRRAASGVNPPASSDKRDSKGQGDMPTKQSASSTTLPNS
jgi:hypothetical protein